MSSVQFVVLILAYLTAAAATISWIPMSSSRWSLAVALSFAIPVVGPLLALIAFYTQGTDQVLRDLRAPELERQPDSAEEVESTASRAPLLDRLLSEDPGERLCALVTISHRADADSLELLRWTIEHGDSEAVLDAALTLEEIEIRWQHDLEQALEAAAQSPCYETLLARARLSAEGVINALADPASLPRLLNVSRRSFEQALALDLSKEHEVGFHLAKLELAAGRPTLAYGRLISLPTCKCRSQVPREYFELLNRARFAARDVHHAERTLLPELVPADS